MRGVNGQGGLAQAAGPGDEGHRNRAGIVVAAADRQQAAQLVDVDLTPGEVGDVRGELHRSGFGRRRASAGAGRTGGGGLTGLNGAEGNDAGRTGHRGILSGQAVRWCLGGTRRTRLRPALTGFRGGRLQPRAPLPWWRGRPPAHGGTAGFLTGWLRRRCGGHVGGQQLLEQLPHFRTRVHAELIGDDRAGPLVDGQGLRPPARSVQRPHEQQPQLLLERLVGQQPPEVRDDQAMPATRDVRLDAQFQGRQAQLVQPVGFGFDELRRRDVGQGGAPPQGQGISEQRRGPIRMASRERLPALAHQEPEMLAVQIVPAELQLVTRSPGAEDLPLRIADEPAQPEHVDADEVGRAGRRVIAPDRMDEAVGGHGLTPAEQQVRQKRPPLGGADRGPGRSGIDLKRAQDAEPHNPDPPDVTISSASGT